MALESPRLHRAQIRHLIKGDVIRTSSWLNGLNLAAEGGYFFALPAQIEDFLARFNMTYLSRDHRLASISAGILFRNSAVETRIGQAFLAIAREEMEAARPTTKAIRDIIVPTR